MDDWDPVGRAGAPVPVLTIEGRGADGLTHLRRPRLTWRVEGAGPGWAQARAVLRCSTGEMFQVVGGASALVDWPFEEVRPRRSVRVQVRLASADGARTGWSPPLSVAGAMLDRQEWAPLLVGRDFHGPQDGVDADRPILLRRAFALDRPVERAFLYTTAHGVHQAWVNGTEVDDHLLKPGWTSYRWRLFHECTDVTRLLREGQNAIGIALAGGWYTELYGPPGGARRRYCGPPAAAAHLRIRFRDGTSRTIDTDEQWRWARAATTSSGIYAGEAHDARQRINDWSSPVCRGGTWRGIHVVGTAAPVPRSIPPVVVTQTVRARRILAAPDGTPIVDFGQNIVGRVRIRVEGTRGQVVVLKHAEVLEDGDVALWPLRTARATDSYTLRGGGAEEWAPRFTFHGFRYVRVEGWPTRLAPHDLVAEVIGSDLRATGGFACSHTLVNRLHRNIVWGTRGNFLSIPTDCPQRDERLGWTGDIQVFSPTACLLFDVHAFLGEWLANLACEQKAARGNVPLVVPNVLDPAPPTAGWGDAACAVPWALWWAYGDKEILRRQYGSMRAWMRTAEGALDDDGIWRAGPQFGDWLDPSAPPDDAARAMTDPALVATAYAARSAQILHKTARELGHHSHARAYQRLSQRIARDFTRVFVTRGGALTSDTQTAYSLAIAFSLVDARLIRTMGDRLARLVEDNGHRIATGFLGTPLVTGALTRTGHIGVAERLLLQTRCPSWLYPITAGATTVWERWDGIKEDGGLNRNGMTSFNHYAFGAVADWLHRTVAGLSALEPGYRTSLIRPPVLAEISSASAWIDTHYGRLASRWFRDGGGLVVEAAVPPNTTARIQLPGAPAFTTGSGEHAWRVPLEASPRVRTRGAGGQWTAIVEV